MILVILTLNSCLALKFGHLTPSLHFSLVILPEKGNFEWCLEILPAKQIVFVYFTAYSFFSKYSHVIFLITL